MSLCESIDTLSMAYLDDELAAEERRELELHLLDCASCKQHLDSERADLKLLRTALVAPPAPDTVVARITRALDSEDQRAARAGRQKWARYVLPGSAVIAAAAALLLFVGVSMKQPQPAAIAATAHEVARPKPSPPAVAVTHEVVRQQTRPLPLEVQGASTGSWLREHFAAVEPPQFEGPGIQLIGARATAVQGHDAALLRYLVSVGINRVSLTAVLIVDVHEDMFSGHPVRVGNLTLRLADAEGQPVVTYVDDKRIGYVFTSERMTMKELLSIVVTSDLIGRAQQQLR